MIWQSIRARLRGTRPLAILAFIVAAAAPAAADERPFGIRMDDPAITAEPLSNALIRTVRIFWSRPAWANLRIVRPTEPLPHLPHYIAEIKPGKGICVLTAISDPFEIGDAQSKLRPVVREIADEIDILYGRHHNSYDQIENQETGQKHPSTGRLTMKSWERMTDHFEVRNGPGIVVATWPQELRERIGKSLNRASLKVLSDSQRHLRAAFSISRDC